MHGLGAVRVEDCQTEPGAPMTKEQVSAVELRLLVLREAIQPVVRLARLSGMSLDDLNALVSSAYYREFRDRGHSHQMMTRRIGKSLRSVASLARKDKDASRPLAGSQVLNAKRAIATRVGKSPLVRSQLVEEYQREHRKSADHESIQAAIDQLLDEGILAVDTPDPRELGPASNGVDDPVDEERTRQAEPADQILRAGANFVSLKGEDAEHRLASLRHLLLGTATVIYQRFYRQPDPEAAFARVLSFRLRRDSLDGFAHHLYEAMREAIVNEDEASDGDEPPATLTFTLSREPTQREW